MTSYEKYEIFVYSKDTSYATSKPKKMVAKEESESQENQGDEDSDVKEKSTNKPKEPSSEHNTGE